MTEEKKIIKALEYSAQFQQRCDEQTMKALECCARLQPRCDECPYRHELNLCGLVLKSQALKLFNRQKAESDRKDKEIERLNGILENYAFEYGTKVDKERFLKKARADAVKEYAKILKTKVDIDLCSAIDCSDYLTDDLPKIIDNLVKEFTEETT